MNPPRFHHYVPRHLINQFKDENGFVHAFNKETSKTFPVKSRIFAENEFNTFQIGEYSVSFEGFATELEQLYLPALRKLWDGKRIVELSPKEQGDILLFMSFQFLRTADFRQRFVEMQNVIRDRVIAIADGRPISTNLDPISDNELKMWSHEQIRKNVIDFAEALTDRHLFLIESPKQSSFILGDSPVVLNNDNRYKLRGNYGWNSTGIQIYLPVSTKYCLAVWCPATLGKLGRELQEIESKLKTLSIMMNDRQKALASLQLTEPMFLDHKTYVEKIYRSVMMDQHVIASHEEMIIHRQLQFDSARRIVAANSAEIFEEF